VDRLPEGTAEKLERLDVAGLEDLLPRNLKVLLDQRM
jgi:hypothetical protein